MAAAGSWLVHAMHDGDGMMEWAVRRAAHVRAVGAVVSLCLPRTVRSVV